MTGPCFEVFTLFPEAVAAFVRTGVLGKAIDSGIVGVHCTSYRDFAADKHRTVDDAPFGGGPGMVLKVEPVVAALEAVESLRGPMHKILLTPSAPRFDQAAAERLATMPRIGLLCGRYEGIDDRVREHFVDECFCVGDFVLNGGEVAALAVIETVARLTEGVLGNPESAVAESFAPDAGGRLLEFPHYTRPAEFRGLRVPDVLLGGDHLAIARYRRQGARDRTHALRPDLRLVRGLPPATPIYLALEQADPPADLEQLADVARHYGVAGLLVVAATAEPWIIGWARASAGRVPVTAFADRGTMRRRLRRSHGSEPYLVGVHLSDALGPGMVRHPGTIIDELLGVGSGSCRPLVLVLAPGAEPSSFDAEFAPNLPEGEDGAAGNHVALRTRMIDPSQPFYARAAALAEQALCRLRPMPTP